MILTGRRGLGHITVLALILHCKSQSDHSFLSQIRIFWYNFLILMCVKIHRKYATHKHNFIFSRNVQYFYLCIFLRGFTPHL